jgi:hypothetical protein
MAKFVKEIRKIEIRGHEYSVESLEGDFLLTTLSAYFSGGSLDDPVQMEKTARAIRKAIPTIPDSLVSEDGVIRLYVDETISLIDFLRKSFFLDNLANTRRLGMFAEEKRFARGYATLLAQLENSKATKEEWEKNGSDEEDYRKLFEPPSAEQVYAYHVAYYDRQIAEAEKAKQNARLALLKAELERIKQRQDRQRKDAADISVEPEKLAVDSTDEAIAKAAKALASEV